MTLVEQEDGTKYIEDKDIGTDGEWEGEEGVEGREKEELLYTETVSTMETQACAQGMKVMEAKHSRHRMNAMCSDGLLGLAMEGYDRQTCIAELEQASKPLPGLTLLGMVHDKQTYIAELEQACKPLPGLTLLGMVHDKMRHWQETHCKRKQEQVSPTHIRTNSCSKCTSQHISGPIGECHVLTREELVGASPEGTVLSEVVKVVVTGARQPVALQCLDACPQLRTVRMSRCGLKVLAGLPRCPLLVEIIVHVCIYTHLLLASTLNSSNPSSHPSSSTPPPLLPSLLSSVPSLPTLFSPPTVPYPPFSLSPSTILSPLCEWCVCVVCMYACSLMR